VSRTVIARWRDWSGEGLEHLFLRERPEGILADSAVVGADDGELFAARSRILFDTGWQARRLEVSLVGDDRRLDLTSDGVGHWTDPSGAPRPDLAGAIDVDLTATPFTNTLPIRRLGLRSGQSETIQVVYVRLPDLSVTTSRQRYTCLQSGRRYRYESVDSDFAREIEIDDDGLVVTYPGLFRRVR
jgi:uncharacterized protein